MFDDIKIYLSTPGIKVCDVYGERPMSEPRIIRWLMENCNDYIELTLANAEGGIKGWSRNRFALSATRK